MDNAELLRRYVEESSQEAFTELVRRNLDLVYSAALRQLDGDSHRARETAQAVFTDLARKAPSLSRHTALTGWLYTSTHFAAAKLRRTELRRRALESEASIMNELTVTADLPAKWERLRPVLDGVMHELNARDREAVLLRFFEQRSFAEVGDHLGLGENAARMTVGRALDKLSGLLASRGVNSTTAALALALTNELGAAAPAGLVTTISSGALAAASTGGLGVTAILNIMSTVKFTSIATVIAIAAVGTAFYATRAARISAGQVESLAIELQARQANYNALNLKLRKLSAQLSAIKSDSADASAPNSELIKKLPDFSTGNPVLDRLLTRRLGWALLGRNEGQLAGVHLSFEKKEKLRGLLLEKAHDERNLTDAAVREGLSAQQQATAKKDLTSSYEAAIEAVLGTEDYIQYKKDLAEFSFKNGVVKNGEIPGCFLESNCPLSSEQADALYSLMYHISESAMSQAATPPSRPAARAELLSRAKEFLSGAQLKALSGYYEADDRVAEEMAKRGK